MTTYAFPARTLTGFVSVKPDGEIEHQVEDSLGMTLRDYFAAKAMQSFMQGAVLPPGFDVAEPLACVAMRAYEVADAMLKAREE